MNAGTQTLRSHNRSETWLHPKRLQSLSSIPQRTEGTRQVPWRNLRKGYIRPSKLLMASPFFVFKKDSKKLGPCQDYRHLNEGTIKNGYPLPRVDKLLDKLKGAKYFTKLDLWWGYNNVRIKIGDKWKAAFKTNKGLFEPLVMFFGLCNSPATFQNMMNDIFLMGTNEGWILIYIDNILIFSKEKEDLQKLTLRVLKKLQENNLFINLDKCTFEAKEVDYLEMIVSKNQIKMDLAKLEGIRDWPTSTTVKQVWSFLGFGNFYRKFIGHYADIAQLLNDLTKKDLVWNWTDACQEVFEDWKKNSRKHQCFWCLIQWNHSSLNLMPPSLPPGQSYNKRHEWRLPLLWIYITLLWCNTTKLWNIWPRTDEHSPCLWNMATLPPRIPFSHSNPPGPQKSHVLQNHPEVEQTTSLMELIPVRIWFETHPHPWI